MKCPGQDPRFWKFDAIFEAKCPGCGASVEFFKDETRRSCRKCGMKVLNPKMDFGCAAHCKFAEQCFGDLPPELIKQKQDLFKDRVAVEMKMYIKNDFRAIGHASRMAKHIEVLAKAEEGDAAVAMSAAYMKPVAQLAEKNKPGTKGTDLVREILDKLGAAEPLMDSVTAIIDKLDADSANARIVADADKLAELERVLKTVLPDPEETESLIKEFVTKTGRETAMAMLDPGVSQA